MRGSLTGFSNPCETRPFPRSNVSGAKKSRTASPRMTKVNLTSTRPKMCLCLPRQDGLFGEAGRASSCPRAEFLAEVLFYDEAERGLGTRFAAAVEQAAARAVVFPISGSAFDCQHAPRH